MHPIVNSSYTDPPSTINNKQDKRRRRKQKQKPEEVMESEETIASPLPPPPLSLPFPFDDDEPHELPSFAILPDPDQSSFPVKVCFSHIHHDNQTERNRK